MYSEITVIIVTYKSEEKIEQCINSIDPNIKIIVIENSSSQSFKKSIQQKYKNVQCIVSNTNLGYGKGNNLGLSLVKTKYALILNPDTVLDNSAIKNFIKFTKSGFEFAIVGPHQGENIFDKKKNILKNTPYETNEVKGYAMFLNISQFKNIGFFDENFFLYLEEIDLCKRIKQHNKKIFICPNIYIFHYGGKSVRNELSLDIELLRNWHWMWSSFYYIKKHKNYIMAITLTLGKFFSSLFKYVLFFIILNKQKKLIYKYRLLGLLNSMLGKKSWYRLNKNK